MHDYDPVSGWCLTCPALHRDDGLAENQFGTVIRHPDHETYTPIPLPKELIS